MTTPMDIDPKTLGDILKVLVANQKSTNDRIEQLLADRSAVTRTAPNTTEETKSSSTMARPEPFKSGSNDARRFIQFFTLWARSKGAPLNSGSAVDQQQWIIHALALMQGEAAVWAVPYLQAIESNTTTTAARSSDGAVVVTPFPFSSSWETFVAAFKARFQAADDTQQAQRELEGITQGGKNVAEYAARFQEVSGRTGFSDADLMTRFRRGLKPDPRKWLALATLNNQPTTLDTLIKQAVQCDFHMRDTTNDYRGSSQSSSSRDPYAMDIDASRVGPSGRSQDDFRAQMRGRCYGCGSKAHTKANGNHDSTKCAYCTRTGHIEAVCMDKFLGNARGRGANSRPRQRAAATIEDTPFSLFAGESSTASIAASNATAAPTAADFAALAATVQEQTRLLSLVANAAVPAARPDFP